MTDNTLLGVVAVIWIITGEVVPRVSIHSVVVAEGTEDVDAVVLLPLIIEVDIVEEVADVAVGVVVLEAVAVGTVGEEVIEGVVVDTKNKTGTGAHASRFKIRNIIRCGSLILKFPERVLSSE
jgi:hypothetical protein